MLDGPLSRIVIEGLAAFHKMLAYTVLEVDWQGKRLLRIPRNISLVNIIALSRLVHVIAETVLLKPRCTLIKVHVYDDVVIRSHTTIGAITGAIAIAIDTVDTAVVVAVDTAVVVAVADVVATSNSCCTSQIMYLARAFKIPSKDVVES